jgi:hypothetical protein
MGHWAMKIDTDAARPDRAVKGTFVRIGRASDLLWGQVAFSGQELRLLSNQGRHHSYPRIDPLQLAQDEPSCGKK